MGNTVSKAVDFGLKATCVATGGLLGKSSDGYHLGPLRLKEDSIGVMVNIGICKFGLKFVRNEFGKFALEASATCGINGIASGSIKGGFERNGIYVGLSGVLKVGPVNVTAGFVADSKGNIRSYNAGATGPLLTNVQYSNERGLSGGIFGCSADKAGNIDYTLLQHAAMNKAGEKIRKKYQSTKEREQCDNKKKEEISKNKETGENKSSKKNEVTNGMNREDSEVRRSYLGNRAMEAYTTATQLQRAHILEAENYNNKIFATSPETLTERPPVEVNYEDITFDTTPETLTEIIERPPVEDNYEDITFDTTPETLTEIIERPPVEDNYEDITFDTTPETLTENILLEKPPIGFVSYCEACQGPCLVYRC